MGVHGIGMCKLKPGQRLRIGGTYATRRRRDSKNFISNSMGVRLDQMDSMNRMLAEKGVEGVKYIPHPRHGQTAVPLLADRQAKFSLMKARGMFDKDETRG